LQPLMKVRGRGQKALQRWLRDEKQARLR
jgi:hypothetical protein